VRILCVFGKNQYGVPSRGLSTEYEAFIPGFRQLGHEVAHFDSWGRSGRGSFRELNQELVERVDAERPELVFCVLMDAEIWKEALQLLKNRGDVATVAWTTDDSWKFRTSSRFVAADFHAVATTYDYVVPKYQALGQSHVILTQWAAPDHRLANPLPAAECTYDVTFVGAAHGPRRRQVEELRRAGVAVECFGHGWAAGPISTDRMFEVFRQSRISLNFANSRRRNQIKARTFEAPGAGGLLLTEQAPGLEKFFDAQNEIGVFSDLAECATRVRELLADPERRDRMANAGQRRVAREHTYSRRLSQVVAETLAAAEDWRRRPATGVRDRQAFDRIAAGHCEGPALRALRRTLVRMGVLLMGRERGPRLARRLLFELSWRLAGAATYSAAGWYGRMFPFPNDRRDLDGAGAD